MSNKWGCSRF